MKSANLHALCRTRADYFLLWESDHEAKPCLEKTRRGLGDLVAYVIHLVTAGRVKMCAGCQSRRTWLNARWFMVVDWIKQCLDT